MLPYIHDEIIPMRRAITRAHMGNDVGHTFTHTQANEKVTATKYQSERVKFTEARLTKYTPIPPLWN